MQIKGWRYYNHAAIPSTQPHENPDIGPIEDGSIWKMDGSPLLARWTTDFDCGYETNWWYTIIDKPFDITSLKSDYRRRITVGMRHFSCRMIDPKEYCEMMAKITKKDWETYPKSYRPQTSEEELSVAYKSIPDIVWGAFDLNGELSAFQIISDQGCFYSLGQGKSDPEKQKLQVNAALIASYLNYYESDIASGKYISNGTRNILHETNFNEDLCKKYGFRKAYCKLNIKYRFLVGFAVNFLYPFRNKIKSNGRIGKLLVGILSMEEINRAQKKKG